MSRLAATLRIPHARALSATSRLDATCLIQPAQKAQTGNLTRAEHIEDRVRAALCRIACLSLGAAAWNVRRRCGSSGWPSPPHVWVHRPAPVTMLAALGFHHHCPVSGFNPGIRYPPLCPEPIPLSMKNAQHRRTHFRLQQRQHVAASPHERATSAPLKALVPRTHPAGQSGGDLAPNDPLPAPLAQENTALRWPRHAGARRTHPGYRRSFIQSPGRGRGVGCEPPRGGCD